jgi:hypothetical protein
MEEAKGEVLNSVWDDFDVHSKMGIVDQLVSMQARLCEMDLGGYGSLYFTEDALALNLPHFPIDTKPKGPNSLIQRFCLGPLATLDSTQSLAGPCEFVH